MEVGQEIIAKNSTHAEFVKNKKGAPSAPFFSSKLKSKPVRLLLFVR